MAIDTGGKYQDFVLRKADGTVVAEGEPVFVLRAQDMLAPKTVQDYADLYQAITGDRRHADEIRNIGRAMSAWPDRKLPD